MEITTLRCEYLFEPQVIEQVNPRLSWILSADGYQIKQKLYRIIVSDNSEQIRRLNGTIWDTGKVKSSECNQIQFNGSELKPFTKYYWRVGVWADGGDECVWSNVASWSMGLMNQDQWQGKWLNYAFDASRDVRIFRTVFNVVKPVSRAVLYSTARGIYEPHINGKAIDDSYFAPGWTDYKKRLYYQGYDITTYITHGSNALGALLAEGWFKGHVGYTGAMSYYGYRVQLLMNLRIEYTDGTVETISTDDKWKTKLGPSYEASFLMGEKYDSRKCDAWDTPEYDDSSWSIAGTSSIEGEPYWDNSVMKMLTPESRIEASPSVAVREYAEIFPVNDWQPCPGSYIFDLGQNFAGIARIKVKGETGTIVRLRFAEVLNPDKTMYVENLRSAISIDEITLNGGEQTWQPKFTFHGFRYVEVTGICRENILEVTGIALSSDTTPTGKFSCSNKMVNKLYSNIIWTQRSNFIDIPTDCPQRDERLGWTGDAQVFIKSAAYNMDVASFFKKWLVDLEDTQLEDGSVSNIAPHVPIVPRADAAWGDAVTVCPWWIYQYYGDKEILRRHYAMVQNWIKYLGDTADGYIRQKTHCFGDWLSINAPTPNILIQTAFYAYSSKLAANIASVLEKQEDYELYTGLFEKIKSSFIEEFVADDGKVEGDTQTSYVLALHFDLLPEELRGNAASYLREKIRERDDHLSTGFVGTPYLLPTLSENGMHDLAMKLLQNDTYPSWGYSIKSGATTIWERWNGWTETEGCGDANMNSYSHYAYGSVCEWMFSTLAGIKMETPGFADIVIAPKYGKGIDWVNAEYNSIRGPIESSWKKEGNTFTLNTSIPANTRARIHLPKGAVESPQAEYFCNTKTNETGTVIDVMSGKYEFRVLLA